MAISQKINKIHRKIKLLFYRSLFKRVKDKEDVLSSSEYLCLECIFLMDKPTISQFADFLDISSPNATYKVKTLIKKGFLTKEKSAKDGREYILVPTQKFFELYDSKEDEINENAVQSGLSVDESKKMKKVVRILTEKN